MQEENVEQLEETPEVKHEGFISDDKHTQRIGVQHKKFRDQERRANDLETQLGEANKKLEAVEIKEVVVPAVPDPLSETYAEDVQKRDAAIQQKTELDAGIARKAEVEKQKDEVRVTKDAEDLKQRVAGFEANTVTHGLNRIEVGKAADTVVANGLSEMFESILLEDTDGPLITLYLENNPVEQHEMNGMSALQLVTHINEIRPKASLLKPQTSNAPDPPIVLSGGGVEELQPPWEKGAKYE